MTSAQITACDGIADGEPCVTPLADAGECRERACILVGCGNGLLEAGEACDDGNALGGDGCSARCDSNEACGNAFLDTAKSEGCDCGSADFTGTRPPGCNGMPNSDAANAVCTSTCQIRGCGDGVVGGLEDCDGTSVPITACSDVGFYSGTVGCLPSCRYDVSACSGRCNDGVRNGPPGGSAEDCDTSDLNSATCQTFGYYNANGLACNSLCSFDVSQCTGFCGDGTYQASNEACESGETEQQLNARGLDCTDFGFYAPAGLACSDACQIDTSACGGGRCGDGAKDAAEDCDGAALSGNTCMNFGYYAAGTLACRPNCTWDFAGCASAGRCGDATTNGPEQCDTTVAAGIDCLDFNYYTAGTVTCNSACAFNLSQCSQRCGDGTVNGPEQCDGSLPAGFDCTDFGFYQPGTLQCTGCTFDTSMCSQRCGDGLIQNPPEECDGSALAGRDCTSFGFYTAGGLACSGACSFDTNACVNYCGDNVLDAAFEDCDSSQLAGLDCTDFGFYNTVGLSCASSCTFDVAACTEKCGDDIINGPESCDGAPTSLACANAGYDAGGISCSTGCYETYQNCRTFGFNVTPRGVKTTVTLNDAWGVGTTFFAVGRIGTVVRHANGGVMTIPSSTTVDLNGVWGNSTTDVFIVGASPDGTNHGIWRYNGSSIALMPIASQLQLTDVWGTSATDVWAVGFGGRVLRYTGSWAIQTTPIPAVNLRGVWAIGSTVFVVGNAGTIYRYNGSWTNQSTGSADFTDVWGYSATDVYATTGTAIYHYNGTTWSLVPEDVQCNQIGYSSLGGMPGGTVYVFGITDDGTGTGAYFAAGCKLVNGRFERIANVPTSLITPMGVAGSTDRIYVVGSGSTLVSSGAEYLVQGVDPVNGTQRAVWGTAGDNVYVAGALGGNESIYKFDGSSWSLGTGFIAGGLHDITGGTGWAVAVGNNGRVLASNGTTNVWTGSSIAAPAFRAVWGNSTGTSVFAVGDSGTLAERASGTWTVLSTGVYQAMYSVWGTGTTIFAVGLGGQILRKVGAGAFTPMTSPTTNTLFRVWGRSATSVYAAGNDGLFHYDGTTWRPVPGPTSLGEVWGNSVDLYASAGSTLYSLNGGHVLPIDLSLLSIDDIDGTAEQTWIVHNMNSVARISGAIFDPAGSETSCVDFWDNDDNGFMDCADSACDLATECQGGGKCQPIVDLACGANVMTTTTGGVSRWGGYGLGCAPGRDMSGPEKFYRVRRPTNGNISVTLSGFGSNLDVIVSGATASNGACIPDESCITASQTAAASEVATFAAVGGRDYYVIVDGVANAQGTFTLTVSCP